MKAAKLDHSKWGIYLGIGVLGRMQREKILIIEDDPLLLQLLCTFLGGKGYTTLAASDCATGQRIWNSQQPDAAVIDHILPDGNSLNLLSRWKAADPNVPIVVLTGNGSIEVAVKAVKLGAEQFVTKPIELTALHLILESALEISRKRRKRANGAEELKAQSPNPFLGSSAAIKELSKACHKMLHTDSSILITGETGIGKGVLARWLHENSPRASESFIDLNCAGLSRELLDSELFGHEKGAFTGAVQCKPGLLELGHRGTVFLDEIGDMELQIQPRLLKVIEDKKFRRVGDVRDRAVDVRFLAGTHCDLLNAVQEKRFRSDLYFRIGVLTLPIPPLRERPEDVPAIAESILSRISVNAGSAFELAPDAIEAMENYAWPGNIREMRNVLERAALLAEGYIISGKHLHFMPEPVPARPRTASQRKTITEVEREHINTVLRQENWNVKETARKLGIPRSSLYMKLKEYGLTRQLSNHVEETKSVSDIDGNDEQAFKM
jgi:DNA-binding NtrC family response regulator